MLSKNNYSEKIRDIEPKRERFSIRKFTVGAASVLIGCTFLSLANGQTVKADTPNGNDGAKGDGSDVQQASDQQATKTPSKVVVEKANTEQTNISANTGSVNNDQQAATFKEVQKNDQADTQKATSSADTDKTTTFTVPKTDVKAKAITVDEAKAEKTSDSQDSKVKVPSMETKRIINLNWPNGEKKQATSYVGYYKKTTQDSVTGKVAIAKDWTLNPNNKNGNKYPEQDITAPGYTAKSDQVNIINKDGKSIFPETESVVKDGVPQDSTYNVTYDPMAESRNVVFQDEDGKTIHTQTFNGKTGDDLKVSLDGKDKTQQLEVPKNWQVAGSIPVDIPLNDPTNNQDIVVKIKHQQIPIDPNSEEAKKNINIVRQITRTVNVTYPQGSDEKPFSTKQVAEFWRSATKDAVTGDTSYGNWQAATTSDGTKLDNWSVYPVGIQGYTTIAKDDNNQTVSLVKSKDGRDALPAVILTANSKNQTVNVSYSSNAQKFVINYIDNDDNQNKNVGQQVVSGKTGETVKVVPKVPAG